MALVGAGILIFYASVWLTAGQIAAASIYSAGLVITLAILLYLAMGWSGVIVARPLFPMLPLATCILIVVGGVIYSAGVIFHVWEKLKFQNAIWHGFVVAAAAVHYAAVITCFSLAAPGA